jgi:BirA family biotin operon repressor/biotin-[acetyl-CoA-carboxylase] ligase
VCGILTEVIETDQGRAAVVGIGINLAAKSLPDELTEVATSIEDATGIAPNAEALLHSLMLSLSIRYEAFHQDRGHEVMLTEWAARSSYSEGMKVRVRLDDETVVGMTRGLESDGALRVETVTGEIRIVRAGDVTALRDALGATPQQ